MGVVVTRSASGNTQPTVGELMEALAQCDPTDLVQSMSVANSQRDGWYWAFVAKGTTAR